MALPLIRMKRSCALFVLCFERILDNSHNAVVHSIQIEYSEVWKSRRRKMNVAIQSCGGFIPALLCDCFSCFLFFILLRGKKEPFLRHF